MPLSGVTRFPFHKERAPHCDALLEFPISATAYASGFGFALVGIFQIVPLPNSVMYM